MWIKKDTGLFFLKCADSGSRMKVFGEKSNDFEVNFACFWSLLVVYFIFRSF